MSPEEWQAALGPKENVPSRLRAEEMNKQFDLAYERQQQAEREKRLAGYEKELPATSQAHKILDWMTQPSDLIPTRVRREHPDVSAALDAANTAAQFTDIGPIMKGLAAGTKGAMFLGPTAIAKLTGVAKEDIPQLTRELIKHVQKVGPMTAFDQGRLFLGKEGLPRMEVPDTGAYLKEVSPPPGSGSTLKHMVLQHPTVDIHGLYNIPPMIEDPTLPRGVLGSADTRTNQITLSPEDRVRKWMQSGYTPEHSQMATALHEVTHPMQVREGMARGSSPIDSPDYTPFYQLMGAKPPSAKSNIPGIYADMIARHEAGIGGPMEAQVAQRAQQAYEWQAGETEARNVPYRWIHNMYDVHPDFTANPAPSKQFLLDALK